jgi:hypothetical protein
LYFLFIFSSLPANGWKEDSGVRGWKSVPETAGRDRSVKESNIVSFVLHFHIGCKWGRVHKRNGYYMVRSVGITVSVSGSDRLLPGF